MRGRRARGVTLFSLLVTHSLLWTASSSAGEPRDRDEQLLVQAGIDTSPSALLDFLRLSVRARQDPKYLAELIRQLGSDNFAERERASRRLVVCGPQAVPHLRAASSDSDAEVARRARDCLKQLERNAHVALPSAVIRLLIRYRPAGTIAALLAYLPSAGEEAVEEEIWYGLSALAVGEGKIDPALLAAQQDPEPVRRAAAGCMLARHGGRQQYAAVRRLLADPQPLVRLRTAQGLLAARDREAIPTLLALLDTAPMDLAWQAEELLHCIAGETAPESVLGVGDAAARKKCRDDWERWWRQQKVRLDLMEWDKDHRRPGLVLIQEAVPNHRNRTWTYRLWMSGCDGKPRWVLENIPDLADIQWMAGGRLLLAERGSNRILERDLKGNISRGQEIEEGWTVLTCRRLVNGNTFLATTGALREIDPRGEEVYQHLLRHFHPAASSIRQAHKRANGRILCVTDDGAVLEVDAASGQVSQLLKLKPDQVPARQFRILNDDRLLVPMDAAGQFQELEITGKQIAGYVLPHLQDATRLRDGLTLAACADAGKGWLFAVDRTGQEHWRTYCEGEPHLVRVCLPLIRFGFDPPTPGSLDPVQSRIRELSLRYVPARRGSAAELVEVGPKARSAVPALITALGDTDEEVRQRATQALAAIGPAAYPQVVRALQARNRVVRAGAASVLALSDSAARLAMTDLIELLQDADSSVRAQSARTLAAIGPEAADAEQDLVRLLDDKAENVRLSAIAALETLAPQSPRVRQTLVDALARSDPPLRSVICDSLGRIGSGAESIVAALIAALKDKETSVSVSAATALGRIGPKAKTAVPHLLEVFRGTEGNRCVPILEALGRIGPEAKAAVPSLMDILKDTSADLSVRAAAAYALGEIGPPAQSAIPALKATIETSKHLAVTRGAYAALARLGPEAITTLVEHFKKQATKRGFDATEVIEALRQAGPAAQVAVPELLRALDDRTPYTFSRKLIPYALGDIGPEAKDALPRLLELLKSPHSPLTLGILYALPRIDSQDKAVFAALCALLKDEDRPLAERSAAAQSLAHMDAAAGDAVSPLIEALKTTQGGIAALAPGERRKCFSKLRQTLKEGGQEVNGFHNDLRVCCCLALGQIGVCASGATSAVAELLREESQAMEVRWSAAWALGRFGTRGRAGVSALMEVLKDPDASVELRGAAATALARMGAEIVPTLREALRDPNWCTRYWTLESLAAMGTPAEAVVPMLQEKISGQDKLLAREAAWTLKKIRKQ